MPHIKDLEASPTDIDTRQSIRRLLELGETALRQAEMSREFGRSALALKDYMRSYFIAVEIVSQHRDYLEIKTKQGETAHLHKALLKKLSQKGDVYDIIRQDVIADNKRTGVQPAAVNGVSSVTGTNHASHQRDRSSAGSSHAGEVNGSAATHPSNGSPVKAKPAVGPKPASLHGNALPSGHGRSQSTTNVSVDLVARFANLRGPLASPGQDPRIRTYAIVPQKPAGPRDMPPSPVKAHASSDAFPKPPDAIYSPARGSISGEAAKLPTSTPRGLYSRTGSSTSVSSPSAMIPPRQSNEYFVPLTKTSTLESVPETAIRIPDGETITPEELYDAMKAKGTILIIDIRAREDFDEGHVMSSSTICVEPSILMRDNISSDDISESMILSPSPEQALFDKRDSYDIVVFYDQDSTGLPRSPKNSDEVVVMSLHRALVHLNYRRDLRNSPKLLKGGLDAWVDLMGQGSLQVTESADSKATRLSRRHGLITRRGSKYVVTSLKPGDVKAWQNSLANEGGRPAFPRTGDEFMRFPPISVIEQSMTSSLPASQPQQFRHDLASRFGTPSQLPAPPAKPQAAVQRPSHSGLTQGDHEGAFAEAVPTSPPGTQRRIGRTGLHNPRNWCYANSTLQSLLASPSFGRELADSAWVQDYKQKVPRKEGEKIEQPQLMIQMISKLFYLMCYGSEETQKAQLLMVSFPLRLMHRDGTMLTMQDYSRHLCKSGDPQTQFGGPDQQDAQEFMSFIMDQLHDETNLRRDRKGTVAQPDTKRQPLLQAAKQYWHNHLELNRSIVDRYWRGLDLSTVRCSHCLTRTYTFSPFEWLPVTVNQGRDMTLAEALQAHTADNDLDDFECDHCGGKRHATQSLSLARLPRLLCIGFRRFHFDGRDITKSNAAVTWDLNDFDFSPYFLNSPSDREGAAAADDRNGSAPTSSPFRYECYAVIVHAGRQINTGHYYAYVRDTSTHDPYAWLCCNDSSITKVRIGSRDSYDVQRELFRSGTDRVPYLVFFRRKGG